MKDFLKTIGYGVCGVLAVVALAMVLQIPFFGWLATSVVGLVVFYLLGIIVRGAVEGSYPAKERGKY